MAASKRMLHRDADPSRPTTMCQDAEYRDPDQGAPRAGQPFEPDVVRIPAGEFLMGSDPARDRRADDDEQPQHSLHLPEYEIGRTPVTNAQYLAFVQAAGQDPPRHWQLGQPPAGKGDHPVVDVSWHDAVNYCRWLAKLTGKPYRLPSEAEWEKAARGSDGRIYPWGDEWDAGRCNSTESGIGTTTPVGAHPAGASPYGLLDVAGNVWEWTRSLWGPQFGEPEYSYPYRAGDGREDLRAGEYVARVVRGGSYYLWHRYARCASRYCNYPFDHYPYGGFRVVVSSPPPSRWARGRGGQAGAGVVPPPQP